jgi:type IV secretory pathway VirB3-like protein
VSNILHLMPPTVIAITTSHMLICILYLWLIFIWKNNYIYIYIYIILEYSKKILQFSSLKFVLEEKGKLKILAFPKII